MTFRQEQDTVRRAYDVVAGTYVDMLRATDPELPVDLAMVEHFAALLSGQRRVLDAGCGPGRMMPRLAGLGCQVEGMDLSPEMIRRSRRDHPSFPAQVGSLTALPYDDASLDGIFSWYSTIHSPDADLATVLAEMRRVLRPGGVVLVAFQSGTGVQDLAEAYRRRGHEVSLQRVNRSAEEMSAALAAAGLVEVARLTRGAAAHERDPQSFVIARAG